MTALLNPPAEHKVCLDMVDVVRAQEMEAQDKLCGNAPLDREDYLRAHSRLVTARNIREALEELYRKRFNR